MNTSTVTMAVTVVGSALTAAAALPYILEIARGRAQPRIASWSIWAVVQAIGAASAFGAGQLPTACYTLLCAAGCAAVVFLGWRHGSREFGRLDAVCVTLAAEGVALLAVATWVPGFIPTSWAVAVSVATDFLAYLPTFHHAWRRPGEEPWVPYAMFGAAAALVLLVADYRILVGVIYPTYLFAAGMRDASGKATFTLPNATFATTATVVGEKRTLPMQIGSFSDTQIEGLTATQMAAFAPAQMKSFTTSQLADLSGSPAKAAITP